MNWEAIGAVGETLGALGVIVTLVYLAGQLRQNTRALRSASYEHWNDVSTSYTDFLSNHAEALSEIESHNNLHELTSAQNKLVWAMAILGVNQAQTAFLQHRAGALDEDVFDSRIRQFEAWIQDSPLLKETWISGLSAAQTPAFVEFVEARVSGLRPQGSS
jgi:hypothetical protein